MAWAEHLLEGLLSLVEVLGIVACGHAVVDDTGLALLVSIVEDILELGHIGIGGVFGREVDGNDTDIGIGGHTLIGGAIATTGSSAKDMGTVLGCFVVGGVLHTKDLFLCAEFAPQGDGVAFGRVCTLVVIHKAFDAVSLAISGIEGGMREVEADIEDTDDDTLACIGLGEACASAVLHLFDVHPLRSAVVG